MKKKLFAFFAMLFLATSFFACTKKESKKIELTESTIQMKLEEVRNLDDLIVSETVKELDITWKSSAPTVVKVASSGAAQALKLGEATITLSASGYKDATITIKVDPVIELSVNTINLFTAGEDPEVEPAGTHTINATANPESELTYVSSAPAIATVTKINNVWVVTAVAVGTANIIITAENGATTTLVVKVEALNTDPTDVTFNFTLVNDLPEEWIDIFIAGSFPGDHHWVPGHPDLKLEQVGETNVYSINLKDIPRGALEYKYTLGSSNSQGRWFGEKVDGSPTGNRKINLNGGVTVINDNEDWVWESTAVSDPNSSHVEGIAYYTFVVELPEPLAEGQYLNLVGGFGGDYNWIVTKEDMRLTVDDEDDKIYSINLWEVLPGDFEGGDAFSYKLIVGDATTTDWSNAIYEINKDGGNIEYDLDGGVYVITHIVEAPVDGKASATFERSAGTVTVNITVSEGLTAGTTYYVTGSLNSWTIGSAGYEFVELDGDFTITLELPYNADGFEFKVTTDSDWASGDNISVMLNQPVVDIVVETVNW